MTLGEIYINARAEEEKDLEFHISCKGDNAYLQVMLYFILREAAEQMGMTYEELIDALDAQNEGAKKRNVQVQNVEKEIEIKVDVKGLLKQWKEERDNK